MGARDPAFGLQWMPKDMEDLVEAFQQKGHPEMLLSKIAELTSGSEDSELALNPENAGL